MAAKRPLVQAAGAVVELSNTDTLRLTQLAVADGATTPDPGAPVWAWSTTENAPVYWTGSAWVKPAAGGPTLSTPEAVDVVYVDYFLPHHLSWLAITIGAGPVLDTTLPVFSGITLTAGQTVYLQYTDYNGIWVLGSLAVPSAVPLTRHADWPSTAKLRSGTKIRARMGPAVRTSASTGYETSPIAVSVSGLAVDTAADRIMGGFGQHAPCWFRFTSADSGASLPGGLTVGNWYQVVAPTTGFFEYSTFLPTCEVLDETFTPVDFTTTGTNSPSTFVIGTVEVLPPVGWMIDLVVPQPATGDGYLLSESEIYVEAAALAFQQGSNLQEVTQSGYESVAVGWVAGAYDINSTAVGAKARALLPYSTALGSYARSLMDSVAVGAFSSADEAALSVGANVSAVRQSVGLGVSTYSHSQIGFRGPSARFRDAFNIHQLYLDGEAWAVSSYPTKLYTSAAQRTSDPTRSGWRVHGSFAGVTRFVGHCVVTFRDVGTDADIGHAVLLLEGSTRTQPSSTDPVIQYQVVEEESSFPGTVSLTLSPSSDPLDPTSMIEVELSCTLSTGSYSVRAYLGVQVWSVHYGADASSSYVDSKVNRANAGLLLTASEALTAGDLVNFWSDGGVAKMRKADASDDRAADGYVLQAVASGDKGYAYLDGLNDVVSGLTVGSLYLGESGAAAASASGAGGISQSVGFATSATSFVFQRGLPVQL
jgi:hypothetical protein